MHNQLKVEFYKLKTFPLGYAISIFMLILGIIYGYLKFGVAGSTTEVFASTVCDTSLIFIISVPAAWFIGADFGSRTITNEIKLGYGRFSAILSRTLVVCLLSAFLHIIYIGATTLGYCIAHGFDASIFCLENAAWLFTVLLQLTAVECGTVLICFLAKKSTAAIGLSLIYIFITCNMLRNFFDGGIFTFTCFYFVQKTDTFHLVSCAVSALATAIVFIVAAAFGFRKAELK